MTLEIEEGCGLYNSQEASSRTTAVLRKEAILSWIGLQTDPAWGMENQQSSSERSGLLLAGPGRAALILGPQHRGEVRAWLPWAAVTCRLGNLCSEHLLSQSTHLPTNACTALPLNVWNVPYLYRKGLHIQSISKGSWCNNSDTELPLPVVVGLTLSLSLELWMNLETQFIQK